MTIGLAYSTQLSADIRLVPGNVVIVATDMYGKSPHYWERRVRVVVGEWIQGVTRKHTTFNIFVLF